MSRTPSRTSKVALLAGYLGLLVAILVAHSNPATGYEISLYAATPSIVWAGLAVALVTGAAVALFGGRDADAAGAYVHRVALVLIGCVALSVMAMPLLRGYTFYGSGDSLSHVGWAREIAAGTLAPTDLLYPGIHTMTVVIARVADVALTQANLYVILVGFPLAFLLSIPPAVRLLTDAPRAGAVGLLAAAAFVPINNVSVHATAHPASQTILLFGFVLYLALAHVSTGLDRGSTITPPRSLAASTGSMLLLAGPVLVLLHPQQALNVAGFLGGAVTLQWLLGRYRPDHPLARAPSLLAPTAIVVTVFGLWAPRFERVRGAVIATVESLLAAGPTGAAVVGAKSTSLTSVGGSLLEVFLKLFGGATLLSLVAGVVLVAGIWRHRRSPLVVLIAAGLVPVGGLFLVVLAADLGDMYFRYQGFLMVPIAVVGAAGLAALRGRFAGAGWRRVGTTAAIVTLLVLAGSGLVAVHASPYVYQPSAHVSAQQLDGYGASFEHRDPDVPFTGLRTGPRRYVDYHYGTENARERLAFPGYRQGIRPSVFAAANYSSAFEEPRYVATTDGMYQQETKLYKGFRYSESGFRALETTPGVDRVRANDGFQLYYVSGGEA